MKRSWDQLCPEMMRDFVNFEGTSGTLTDAIITLMDELYLEIKKKDLNELIES